MPNPSNPGQAVTFTATVSPSTVGTFTATGTVTFLDGTTTLGSGTLSAGTATFTTSTLAGGIHSITAVYAGDTNFATSTSPIFTQTVKTGTTTTLVSSANPSNLGQAVTFTATVTPTSGTGTPTGTVTFVDGTTTLVTATLANGKATFTTSALTGGTHVLTATYNGDSTFGGSTSAPLSQTVTKATTTTTVTGMPNPSNSGQAVTFTATVSPSTVGSFTATGTVTFLDGTTTLGTGTLSSGTATFTTSTLTGGTHSITAVYAGDTNFATSTSPVFTQTVSVSTTTTLVSSVNPSTLGQAVTFTATVTPTSGTGTPTGMVTFLDGTTTLGSGTLSSGKATFTTSTLALGTHAITASYSGDTSFGSSTSTVLSQTVNKATTTTTVVGTPNPSIQGQPVTFTATISPSTIGTFTASGTVTFLDGTTTLGTNTLSSGTATFTTSTLTVGIHAITAVYAGDTNFAGSTSPIFNQIVNTTTSTATTTTLVSSLNPSNLNQAVTFTATVTPTSGTGTPTGTVTFLDGSTTLGTGTLSGGRTTFTTSTLSGGTHSITGLYSGDSTFGGSISTPLTQTVNKATTTTAVTVSPNPSSQGQTVTFTATISPSSMGSFNATGTVTFMDGSASLGTGTVSGGTATFTTSTLSTGMHSITAVYAGDTNFAGSTSPVFTQTVTTATTTTTLVSSLNPSNLNQAVTFTATVTPTSGTGMPTGTVTFLDGTTTLGTSTLSSGHATFTTSALSGGTHSITASYSGDTNFTSSTSAVLSQTVTKATTTTTVTGIPNPSTFGQPVTFTATVSPSTIGSFTASGAVTFLDGTTTLGTGTLTGSTATFTTSTLSVGAHSITAVYAGDTNFATSTSPAFSQTVNTATSTTTLVSSANPSNLGQAVTFTATVTPSSGTGTPTGTVTFIDGSTTLGTGTLSSGQATFTTSTLTAGSHLITARYNGDTNFSGSSSSPLNQTVNKVSTASAVVATPNPATQGQVVTFTATVSPSVVGLLTATGTVAFLDGTTTLGTGTLSGGTATFTTSTLTIGTHSITAVYSGDANFAGSTSVAINLVVNASTPTSTTTAVTSSLNPSMQGQAVMFTATVTPTSGTGTPTGTATFLDGTTTLGTATLSGGKATFTISTLTTGNHVITVAYSGDANFSSSTSPALTQTVNAAMGATTTNMLNSSPNPSNLSQAVTFTAVVKPTSGTGTPTGIVTFVDGNTALGTATLSSGMATFTTVSLTGGTHSITATYNGDSNFAPSSSTPLTQIVNKVGTTSMIVSSVNPSFVGQAVIFTVNVTVGSTSNFTPTGTIAFFDGIATLGTSTLSNGAASFTISSLSVGTHTITATYSGDTNFNASTSAPVSQVVNKVGTTTTVASSANPSTVGQQVTFTATVAATMLSASMPTGTVTFFNGVTSLGTGTLSNGTATFTTSTTALTTGTNLITATYNGNANFNTSTSAVLTQSVNKASTTVALTISPNPASVGQTVTYTATITPSPNSAPNATGTIVFVADGTTPLGSVTITNNMAILTSSVLTTGTHTVVAQYMGDSNLTGNNSPSVSVTILQASTVTLTSSANPQDAGQSVVFTATITTTGTATPTGTVTFLNGTATLGTATVSGGKATFTTSKLVAGTYSITASYSGDSNFGKGTSAVLSQVIRAVQFFAVAGAPGHVQILSTSSGSLISDFQPFTGYSGPISVAWGDISGDGVEDLVVSAVVGVPAVKVYDGKAIASGGLQTSTADTHLLASFFAYGQQFNVGAFVAVADVNGDGFADLITGASAGNPHVKVYSGQSIANGTFGANPEANVIASFFAYTLNVDLGAYVAGGDISGDGAADIVTGTTAGNPQVKVYNGMAIKNATFNNFNPDASLLEAFIPYAMNQNLGVFVAVGDTTGDGFPDVITGPTATTSDVRVYSGQAIAQNTFDPTASQIDQFFAYQTQFNSGTSVAAADFTGGGKDDILTGATTAPHYRVVPGNSSGTQPASLFEAIASGLQGGIFVGA
jgi:hypothetical protein